MFEMLGSWSLGDYDGSQSLRWGLECLTGVLGVRRERLWVTVFGGSEECGPDRESLGTWQDLGMGDRVTPTETENWWSNGPVGLCGPDSEMFVWCGEGDPVGDDRWVEVWNHVMMRYRRRRDGRLEPVVPRNVDTGMGFERLLRVLQGVSSVYETDLLFPWMRGIRETWNVGGTDSRRVVDGLRSSLVLMGDGVRPGHTGRSYVLRRLLRRSLRIIGGDVGDLPIELVDGTIEHFGLRTDGRTLQLELRSEQDRYRRSLRRGRREVEKLLRRGPVGRDERRWLWETHGLPGELVDEILERG